MSLDDADAVLAFLRQETGRGGSQCLYAEAVAQCPEHVQDALHKVHSDESVSTPAIVKVLKLHNVKVPGESTIRRHRTEQCSCFKGE